MSSTMTTRLAHTVVRNPVAWSLTTLALLVAGLVGASAPLLIVCSLLAFGRPLLYAALLESEADAGRAPVAPTQRRLPFEQRTTHRVEATAVS